MRNLRYICAQPAIKYYTWQVEVMINNFIDNGINPNNIDILCGVNNNIIPDDWNKLANHYNNVRFFFYNDTRDDKSYIPSIYFNLLKQHIQNNQEVKNDVLFLHDSDIVFTQKPYFNDLLDDNVWYMSDTKSYINYDYIQQKGNDIYEKMCDIIGINYLIPKLMNSNSGGAQYIIKNSTYEFWNKVENDSIKLYKYFCSIEPFYNKKHEYDYPIQKWTSGMWSLLWNAWVFGNETLITDKLSFGWVTNDISDVKNHTILHNAGVTENNKDLFFKGNYIDELPYGKEINVNENKATYFYWNEICKTSKKSIL